MGIGAMRRRGAWISVGETGMCGKGEVFFMAAPDRSFIANLCNHSSVFKAATAALIFVLPVLSWQASAQNTTISGTVYDPRTTASALPLPNVLVYVTTGTVDPLPAGVQCLTTSTPTGAVSYTTTAVDGTFTLGNVPENATYTLVIQAGKWRRQFSETVAAGPLTGLSLHMPSTHAQGDIPLIAIATGSVDALECVLREMGIADTEFTDDNGTTGGRIHLYKGDFSPGADINSSTPSETLLMGTPTNTTLLYSYDMVMFPCQANAYVQSTTELTNLLNYANAGGRVFTTHFSYDRLDPASPYDSQFPPVANWHINQTSPTPDPGVATVNTNFTDGATLAQWLQNAGASYNNTPGQIQISTLRHDLDSVIPPTQSWLTLNNTAAGNPIMQFTFNTPVGAAAANQCGRVLYNEYHVFNASSGGALFPHECPSSMTMTAQGEMLEYALFDLSSFVTPVVVPTLSITFTPSPLIVKQGDSADEVTVNVTNTSSTVEIYSSVILTLTMPSGLTATSLTDATGGWICTLSTLTCTRTTSLAASASDSVTLTVSVPAYTSGTGTRGTITAIASSPNFSNNVTATDTVVFQQQPAITWATPAPITYGTPLSGTQLNATSTLPGSLSYSPSSGTVLGIGQHTLTATFTPTDTLNYTTSTATVTLTVIPATPIVALTSSANPVFTSNPVTYTATITVPAAAPTGTVAFFDGTTQVGSGTVTAGVATFATTAPATGIHSITAVYSGDSNYNTATSPVLSEVIQDFTVTLPNGNGSTTTVPLGGQETYPIVITPVGGTTLPGAVNLSVSGLPLGMTSVLNPNVVAANSPTSTVTLVVMLPGHSAAQPPPTPFGKGSLPVALGLILLPLAGRLRKAAHRFHRVVALAVASAALAVGMTGCQITYTPQSFSFTLTATSGSLSHTTTMDITVQ
jgi:hypothetical protein